LQEDGIEIPKDDDGVFRQRVQVQFDVFGRADDTSLVLQRKEHQQERERENVSELGY
jgi:hypothetical protein